MNMGILKMTACVNVGVEGKSEEIQRSSSNVACSIIKRASESFDPKKGRTSMK